MNTIRQLALKAEPEQTTFTRRTWRDRTLVKVGIALYALGIATPLFVNHYAPPKAPVVAPGATVLSSAHETTTTAGQSPKAP